MQTPIVVEMGSHSLKVHHLVEETGEIRKLRFPWSLGHEVYGTGRLSRTTLDQASDAMEELRKQGFRKKYFFAIATGALRDAEDCERFRKKLSDRIGLEVRVLTGREEASMLAKGYLKSHDALPAFLADIGGGTLELVFLSRERTILRDSLPLGAARVYQLGSDDAGSFRKELVADWIENSFDEASLLTADELHCTGGTVKAASRILDKKSFSAEELGEAALEVEKEGAPAGVVDEHRQRVLLPGLLVLEELMCHSAAKVMHYTDISVGKTFLERLLRRLGPHLSGNRQDYLLNNMRLTNVYPDRRSPE